MTHLQYPQVVLGSRNRKKIGEMSELLLPHGITLVGVCDYPNVPDVVEDGNSFAENARKKARETAQHVQQWVIAEDSGLCVDALKGAPGIYSARFAGTQGDNEANNQKLLQELRDLPADKRGAYYVCYAVLVDPRGEVRFEAEGRCHGQILTKYHGSNGFGYDPLFLVREYHLTFGELSPAVKRHISHRAKAFERLIPGMLSIFSQMKS